MTSLDHDHDTQNTTNTNSDCDWDCWEADNWGDMEQQSSNNTTNTITTTSPSKTCPKNHDQWNSLEEEPVSIYT